ncbi:MAG: hypothetical protein FJ077_07055 [Cyanobacteria bacterium K_DeepCast_35m_m2_023]|nr:hypothetical protein [Cyanobacteria bacterium K_DeepCast_35m_m2_023]
MTPNEARSRLPGFLEQTDREIALHRGELELSVDEQIDTIPDRFDLEDPVMVELLLNGIEVDARLDKSQATRMAAIVKGETKGKSIITASELIERASSLKSPAKRTKDAWIKELDLFMEYCKCASPLSCSREQAVSYRSLLLERVSANTTKTRLSYLSGLWSVAEELWASEHIWRGLTKRIKVEKNKRPTEIKSVDTWEKANILIC